MTRSTGSACPAILIAVAFSTLLAARENALGQAVTVDEDPAAFTLSNGIVTARVSKRSGDLMSLQYYDYLRLELDDPSAPPAALASAAAPPTLFIAGDSTAANGAPGAIGWGRYLETFLDPSKLRVVNLARGGRSSRTFVTEGHWDRLLAGLKAGDFVLIQFGHNDAGPINDARRARGSLPGVGDESQEIDNLLTRQHEVVRTFGWYLRKMIGDAKAKGATPILLSLTVRNIWKEGSVERGSGRFGEWTRAVATSQHVPFVDLTTLVANRYEQMGEDAVKALFPRDHTHTSDEGAKLNAELVVNGLRALPESPLKP